MSWLDDDHFRRWHAGALSVEQLVGAHHGLDPLGKALVGPKGRTHEKQPAKYAGVAHEDCMSGIAASLTLRRRHFGNQADVSGDPLFGYDTALASSADRSEVVGLWALLCTCRSASTNRGDQPN